MSTQTVFSTICMIVYAMCDARYSDAQESELHFARWAKVKISDKVLEGELSPDGAKVVYSARISTSREIFVANADGSNPVQLTKDSIFAFEPCWSLDGTQIMFSSSRTGKYQVYSMAVDGSNNRQLTDEPNGARKPGISPSGWVSWQVMHPLIGKIYPCDLVIVQGDERRKVTRDATYVADYAWSPDGEKICYATAGQIVFYELESGDRTVMNLSEADDRLFGHRATDITWGPDGEQIACQITFFGGRASGIGGGEMPKEFGDDEVFLVKPDQKSLEVIEKGALDSYSLDWVRHRFQHEN